MFFAVSSFENALAAMAFSKAFKATNKLASPEMMLLTQTCPIAAASENICCTTESSTKIVDFLYIFGIKLLSIECEFAIDKYHFLFSSS